MASRRLLSRGSDFLNRALAEGLLKSIDLEGKVADGYDFESPEKTNEFRRHLAGAGKCVKKACIEGAEKDIVTAKGYMKKGGYVAAFRLFCEAATVYAALGHHVKYSEVVSRAALAKYYIGDTDSAVKMLDTIDTLVNHYLALRHVRKGPEKNHKAVKEMRKRRGIVHKLKEEGGFAEGSRWPRRKWSNYHATHQNVRTALNLIYIKACAFAEIGARENLIKEYQSAQFELAEKSPYLIPEERASLMRRFDKLVKQFGYELFPKSI